MEIFLDVLEFLKRNPKSIVFISVDDRQFLAFNKIVSLLISEKIIIKRESQMIKGTPEYRVNLVLDNLLNIERLK
ncbi:MAG: hypothetical protein AABX66_02120 [Nanoarchaeota archaeon]